MRISGFLVLLAMACLGPAAPALAQDQPRLLTLQPDRLPGMCIAMTGAGGVAVSIPCDGGATQNFALPPVEGGPIGFGGKCLTPQGDDIYPPLAAVDCTGAPEQTWTLTTKGELRSAAGRCVSLLGASSRTGEVVYAADCPKDYVAQAWRARYVDFTNVVSAAIESTARPGQCMGFDTMLALYPCANTFRQLFSFDRKALGQIRLMSSCLSGGYAFGALRLGECYDRAPQKWVLMDDGRIVNQGIECITVSTEEGRDVLRTQPCADVPEQKWVVRTFDTAPDMQPPEPAAEEPAEPPTEATTETPVDPAPDIAIPEQPPEPAPQLIPAPIGVVAAALPPAILPPPLVSLQHDQLPGMCVAMSGPDGESESRPCDGSAAQSFLLPGAEGGPILLGTRCLAPKGQGSYPQLYAMTCDGSSEQSWKVSADGEIRSGANRCLSLLGVSSRSGERVYAGECPASLPAHHWRAVATDKSLLKPVLANIEFIAQPGKCLGNDGALGLVDCSKRLGRVFSLDTTGPSQFRMMSSCLASGYVFEGLSLSQCWNMPAQKWSLTPDHQLINGEGKCVAATYENGRYALRTVACLPVPEQQWALKEIEP